MLKVKFNGQIFEVGDHLTITDFLQANDEALCQVACCAKIDGNVVDLREELVRDCELEILTFDDELGKKTFWHTSAHILAQAVQKLWPDAQFGIGPSIEMGFYYDIDLNGKQLSSADLSAIENEMKQIVAQNFQIEKEVLSISEARQFMQKTNQAYKVELIDQFAQSADTVTFYRQGNFVDLCRGPHLMSTGFVKAIKLTSVTGAYWRGDSKNKMLQRIYGVSFPSDGLLEAHLRFLEEANRRDHRRLGKELELFSFMNEGVGFPFFLSNGMIIKNELMNYWRKVHAKAGYQEIATPVILSRSLWERSGHWEHYKSNMYETLIDGAEFAIKPMNCPGAVLVYGLKPHSYKELPIRLGEFGVVHRHELSGALHGLMRARCFTQDDAHIFLTEDQIQDEVQRIINLIDEVYSKFNFKYFIELSTMPEDHIGTEEEWNRATNSLKLALDDANLAYRINEGDGAFYGPKIDFHIRDCLNRSWQCGTVQLDFQLPQRFDLEYVAPDGSKSRPILIHRVVYGSIERFIGILIEHFNGEFPLWLAPVQVKVLPISEHFEKEAVEVQNKLQEKGLRCEVDLRNEKINYKIFQAQTKKVPYMIILGKKEQEQNLISVRKHGEEETRMMSLEALVKELEVELKK